MVGIRDSLKSPICLNYLLSPRKSFWSFYRVQDPFSLCIPISNKTTYIWCNVWMLCDVWLLHEWNVCALDLLLWSFLLLNLSTSRSCTLCEPVGAVSFSSTFEDTFVSVLAHRIVSCFSFLKHKNILVQTFAHKTRGFSFLCFRLHNSRVVNKFAWIMKNHQCHAII